MSQQLTDSLMREGTKFSSGLAAVTKSLLVTASLVLALPASAQNIEFHVELPNPQFVGLGVGSYPDHPGSDDTATGVAPLARLKLGGQRYAQWYATDLRVNLLNSDNWRLGVAGIYRLGRDPSDIDDTVVQLVHKVDSSFDLGAFGGYTWRHPEDDRKRIGFTLSATSDVFDSGHGGWVASANAYAMYPVALPVTLAGGIGVAYASEDYLDENYGVTATDSLASGLAPFSPDSGVRDAHAYLVGILSLSLKWHVGAGVYYAKLLGDAKDSPIVSVRGDDTQVVYGAGFIYAW